MTIQEKRRRLVVGSAGAALVVIGSAALTACGDNAEDQRALFNFGVASGDPLSDRVILWTHARDASNPTGSSPVRLKWFVSTDVGFSSVVLSGTVVATAATGFTAKVDAVGLQPGTVYYYVFVDEAGGRSAVGTTRTLPRSDVSQVKFAVFSCSLYSEGFFNAYEAAAASGAQYAIHLGDYIYEYGSDPAKYGNRDASSLNRVAVPANDIVTIEDYRARYAQYRSDPNLQAIHAAMPFITVWDDHEFTNNAYVAGAENHNSATQGDWLTRKAVAAQAYHEWLPIRTQNPSNLLQIYRRFDFGSLLSLHMIDTRIEGRDRQYDSFGDADGGIGRYISGLTTGTDGSRRMMSQAQQSWLTQGIQGSSATWQLLGNQDIMARMWFPASVLQAQAVATSNPTAANAAAVQGAINAYLSAKATRFAAGTAALTPTQAALLDPTVNPRLPYNLDAWDGYPSQREAILQSIKASGKRLVVITGDSHNGWFANVTTLAGERVGFEFAGASVTSVGFESVGLGGLASVLDGSALAAQFGNAAIGAGLGLVDDLNYSDTQRRGYLLLTVSASSVKGEYVYVSTVKSRVYTSTVGKTVTVSAAGGVSYT